MLPLVLVAGILLVAVVTGLVAQGLHEAYRQRISEQTEHLQVLACLDNADALADQAAEGFSHHHDERAAA